MAGKKKPVKRKSNSRYIFWCNTDLPEDFVYIFSSSELGARRKYAALSCIPMVHIKAKKICSIPPSVLKELNIREGSGLVTDELLDKVGIEFLTKDKAVARHEGKVYQESNVLEECVKNVSYRGPILYLFKVRDRICYKIGFSKKVADRGKQIAGPEKVVLINFIMTPLAVSLETRIKRQFRRFHIGKEFYELDAWGESLLIATYDLYHTEYSRSKGNHTESTFFKQTLDILIGLVAKHKLNTFPSTEDKAAFKALRLLVDQRIDEQMQAFMASLIPKHVLGL